MTPNTRTRRIALAAGIPTVAAAAALIASAASAATSGPSSEHQPAKPATVAAHHRHHAEPGDLRGRANEPGEDAFACIRVAAFRSYAARMATDGWQAAFTTALANPVPCFMCAETLWWQCHRRLVAELLHARGHDVVHLLRPGHSEPHRPWEPIAETRDGVLFLCGERVA